MLSQLIERCQSAPSFERQARLLSRVVANRGAHARFLNTLARLEYVGVRKMLKVRRAETLDADGLQHILEEAVHATRLKKFALLVAQDAAQVATFSEAHTLAGDAAERYFQAVDSAASAAFAAADPELCYLATSTAIEIRAKLFYPAYQELLERADTESAANISVRSIINDEAEHLEHMLEQLASRINDPWPLLAQVMNTEESAYIGFLSAVEERLTDVVPAGARDAAQRS